MHKSLDFKAVSETYPEAYLICPAAAASAHTPLQTRVCVCLSFQVLPAA